MPTSRYSSHTIVSTLLTTRRGIAILSIALLTLYLTLFHHAPDRPERSTTTTGDGVKGWAREYWNMASWSSGSNRDGDDESLGDLKRLKEEKHRKLREEQLELAKQRGKPLEDERPVEWKKVTSEDLFEQADESRGDGLDNDDETTDRAKQGYDAGKDSGSALFTSHDDEIAEAARADSPRVAIEDDEALNRAPMAALNHDVDSSSEPDSNVAAVASTERTTGLADHAAAKAPSQETRKDDEYGRGGGGGDDNRPQNQVLRKPKPKPIAGKPKKIGTGGRVVKPEQVLAPLNNDGPGGAHAAAPVAGAVPAGVEGGGEKAGKVVQAEAGRRVGTGARPGAKGMGIERVDDDELGIGSERRRRQITRRRKLIKRL
ncbi:hypothetical protein JCM3766R1_003858 [Sporobolomyces carnicolor]